MKKEYLKPEILVEEILVTTMLANSGGTNIPEDGNQSGMGGEGGEGDIFGTNDRRGSWGDLWN